MHRTSGGALSSIIALQCLIEAPQGLTQNAARAIQQAGARRGTKTGEQHKHYMTRDAEGARGAKDDARAISAATCSGNFSCIITERDIKPQNT